MSKAKRDEKRKEKAEKKQIRSFTQRVARDTNKGKLSRLNALYAEWQRVAQIVSDKLWVLFQSRKELPSELRSSGDTSNPLYLFPRTTLATSLKDCMLAQAKGALQSWLSNLDNRFNESIQRIKRVSPAYEQLAHELSWINANHCWRLSNEEQNIKLRKLQAQQILKTEMAYTLAQTSASKTAKPYQLPENVMKLRKISPQATRYARELYNRYMKWAKPPSSANQPLMVNVNSVTRGSAVHSRFEYFSHWVNIASLERGSRIVLPLEKNPYLEGRAKKGVPFKATMSMLKTEKGAYLLKVSQEWEAPVVPATEFETPVLGIDLGLKTLLASSEGDLVGEGYLNTLYALDKNYQKRLKVLQKSGVKPSTDPEFNNIVKRIRSYLKGFIRQNVKKLIEHRRPALVRIESLNFMRDAQDCKLSRKLRRIVRNFGQAEFEKTLDELGFEYGFKVEKVASAYTSQTCKRCGFSLGANRNAQKFTCVACGHSGHADVNAACNIARRSQDERVSTAVHRKNLWLAVVRAWLDKSLLRAQKAKTEVVSSIVGDTLKGLKAILQCKKSRQKLGPKGIQCIEEVLACKPFTEKFEENYSILLNSLSTRFSG